VALTYSLGLVVSFQIGESQVERQGAFLLSFFGFSFLLIALQRRYVLVEAPHLLRVMQMSGTGLV
jgi:hypothetical protein